jgi:hypothetical protein
MPSHEPVVGNLATVTHPIVGGKPGEVVAHVRDTTETSVGCAHTNTSVQAQVVVIGQGSDRASDAVRIEAWSIAEGRPPWVTESAE